MTQPTVAPPSPEELAQKELARAKDLQKAFAKIRSQIAQVIVGQDKTIEQLLIAMLAGGHCLLEGVPGLAKTWRSTFIASNSRPI